MSWKRRELRPSMDQGSYRGSILRVLTSILSGALAYSLWLIVFLLTSPEGGFLEILLWIVAPLLTGLGFSASGMIVQCLRRPSDRSVLAILGPVLGTYAGALLVYWFGPMLIVFSMLAGGSLAVILREFLYRRKLARRSEDRVTSTPSS